MSEIMTEQHPITPPPGLVDEWITSLDCPESWGPQHLWIAKQAARWGADQEFKACFDWVRLTFDGMILWSEALRTNRRPPPSLKKQALNLLPESGGIGRKVTFTTSELETIRKALEALPDA